MQEFMLGFNSLEQELSNHKLNVKGTIPEWLQGMLLRNGPAKFAMREEKFRHWFDGFAMLHRFAIQNNEVIYSNKFIASDSYNKAVQQQKICSEEFSTSPNLSYLNRLLSLFIGAPTDNTNVNITCIADHFIAMTEANQIIEFDPESLKTLGHFNYNNAVNAQLTTAHPQYDFTRNQLYNFSVQFGPKCYYNVFRVAGGSANYELLAKISVKHPAYMHSFAMTENTIILVESPLLMDIKKFIFARKPYIENYQWQPQRGTRFIVVDKNDGKLLTEIYTDAFFSFHQINAFENNNEIIIDLPLFATADVIKTFYLEKMVTSAIPTATPTRFCLDLQKQQVTRRQLADCYLELPRINYRNFNTKNYRYTYATSNQQQGDFLNQLVKIDVTKQTHQTWSESGCYPGEPVFVSKSGAKAEDEGVVLSVVLDSKAQHSFLVILEANAFTEIARAVVPHHIPFGFHGQFFR